MGQSNFIPRLESLRGVAAVLVAVYHCGAMYLQYPGSGSSRLYFAFANGLGCVVVFFVISGFVLARSLDRDASISFVTVGMVPTLVANAINAGSPFATTYSPDDATAPEINLAVLNEYLHDMQFVLVLLAVGSTAWLLLTGRRGARQVALVVGGNLLVNLIFFVSHPTFTPYYVVPITMLSLWSMCFALAMQPAGSAEPARLGQAARA